MVSGDAPHINHQPLGALQIRQQQQQPAHLPTDAKGHALPNYLISVQNTAPLLYVVKFYTSSKRVFNCRFISEVIRYLSLFSVISHPCRDLGFCITCSQKVEWVYDSILLILQLPTISNTLISLYLIGPCGEAHRFSRGTFAPYLEMRRRKERMT